MRRPWKFDADVIDGTVHEVGLVDRTERNALDVVGQVDHRWSVCERCRDCDTAGFISGASDPVGIGAAVRVANDRGLCVSFFITWSSGRGGIHAAEGLRRHRDWN